VGELREVVKLCHNYSLLLNFIDAFQVNVEIEMPEERLNSSN